MTCAQLCVLCCAFMSCPPSGACPVQHPMSPGAPAFVCRLSQVTGADCYLWGPLLMKAPCSNPCIKLHLFWPILWCGAHCQLCFSVLVTAL